MNWVEEQIKARKEQDNQMFSSSFLAMANAVTGKNIFSSLYEITQGSIEQILKYYHLPLDNKIPANVDSFYAKLDYLCLKVGLAYREVKLTKGWYKDAIGPFLAFRKDTKEPVALLPNWKGYKFLDNGKYRQVDRKSQNLFELVAICFYPSFAPKKLKFRDLGLFAFKSVPVRNFIIVAVLMLFSTLIGLLAPKVSYFLYGPIIEYKSTSLLISTLIFGFAVTVSQLLFSTYQQMYSAIVDTNISLSVEAATIQRVFSLKPNFFRNYSAGELATRTSHVTSLATSLTSLIFNTTLGSLFSLIYINSIFEYAPALVAPALIIIAITVGYSLLATFANIRISRKRMEISAKEAGLSYSMVSGIQKIRLTGSEKRVFSRWAKTYAEQAKLTYSAPAFVKYNSVISLIITLAGNIVMYFFAIQSGVGVAEYTAFTTAYGMVFGAFSSLTSIALTIANLKPTYELAKPILDAEPETRANKEMVSTLNGNIDISNVSFRYSENMPLILDNLSLKIRSGEYVAIVGKTGCGKSTLVKLLLGFETPQKGTIYYDNKDISSLNVKTLRRKIGTVMQDGKLFQGDIFSNIAVCAPGLTIPEAFEAADLAGIGNDIREMPMGMNTVISEGSGGISGGQRQRLLIARAIAPKPKILIFDEATSALDNITQRNISEALAGLNCTRIVIAHRLSTIKKCDRIICLENGKIVEEGKYDELIAKNGMFADLVANQLTAEK